MRRVLPRMLDEDEFLSPYGIRSISRYHAEHPYVVHVGGTEYRVDYLPAESNSGMFGGNSNWRGPVWFPMNYLLLRGLIHLYAYYGDEFTIECPTGSGIQMTLWEVSQELARRLAQIFLRDNREGALSSAVSQSSSPILTGGTIFSSTSISTAITAPVWVPAIRPAGRA